MKDIKKPYFMQQIEQQKGHLAGLELLIAMALFFVGSLAAGVLQMPAMAVYMFQSEDYLKMLQSGKLDTELILSLSTNLPDWMYVVQLFSEIGFLLVIIAYCYFIEHRKLFTMGFRKKGFLVELLRGILFGVVLIGGVLGFECIREMPDIRKNLSAVMLVLFFTGYLIQGFVQEVFFRGYLLVSLSKRHTMVASIFIDAVVFSLLGSMSADGTMLSYINTLFFGILLGLLFVQFENIWCVGIIHGLWSFAQFLYQDISWMDNYYCTIVLAIFIVCLGYFIQRQGKYVTFTPPSDTSLQDMPFEKNGQEAFAGQMSPREVVRPKGILPEERAEETIGLSDEPDVVFDKDYFKD